MKQQLTDELRAGRRQLDAIANVRVLEDWRWHVDADRWVLKLRLRSDATSQLIPVETDWFLTADEIYPWGPIKLYPAIERGIAATFPHQTANIPSRYGWRLGNPCLDTPAAVLNRAELDNEPYSADERIHWHVERALDWLRSAAREELQRAGDPFELPYFLVTNPERFGYLEDADTFAKWRSASGVGLVTLVDISGNPRVTWASRFHRADGALIVEPAAGRYLGLERQNRTGVWILPTGIPIVAPWKAPENWGELRVVMSRGGVDIDRSLGQLLTTLARAGETYALVGYRMPVRLGEPDARIHWQALLLPRFRTEIPKGFRNNADGYAECYRRQRPADNVAIKWISSGNWHPEAVSSRGKLADGLEAVRILLIGAGALGSALAELLVRAGLRNLIVCDDDKVEMGNLVRHTLRMDDIGESKALATAVRLNGAMPLANVTSLHSNFSSRSLSPEVQTCEVVIDCSGSDSVLHHLASATWTEERLFVSASLGFEARRLFFFSAVGQTFPHADFRRVIGPWLIREREEYSGRDLPREGVGCWNPLFPARIDDVWSFASAAVRLIESRMLSIPRSSELIVLERSITNGVPSMAVATHA